MSAISPCPCLCLLVWATQVQGEELNVTMELPSSMADEGESLEEILMERSTR